MARLDKERQEEFEPKRITYAKQQFEKLGIIIDLETKTELRFHSETNCVPEINTLSLCRCKSCDQW